ncbi:MAG: hypothetical protein H7222_18445 [Methylotenera sp.]|nr:hypothetical protein [Oligoflexia bacterium]
MPRLEPKVVQKELEAGQLWPVYWLHGQEQMKSRELLKRIRKAVLGETADAAAQSFASSFNEELLDASEVNASRVLDAAQSLSLGGGTRLIIVRDAHLLKEADILTQLLGPRVTKEELSSVCVFLSKDLDGRKKFSKVLVEQAAVVPCDEIPEEERDAWITYLVRRKGLEISPELGAQMRFLDPWSLDIIDQELEKYSLAQSALGPESAQDAAAVIQGGVGPELGGDSFLEAFFTRQLKTSLHAIESFADHPDQSLPLLGLLAWNARFLSLVISDRERNSREVKLSPFMLDRFKRWSRTWSMADAVDLQSALAELDFGIKQTQRLSLGLWTDLVVRFCS